MSEDDAKRYILSLYKSLFNREPATSELALWVDQAQIQSAEAIYYAFINSTEYKLKTAVTATYPIGHYYSAIVDPRTVYSYLKKELAATIPDISGISISIDEMDEFWNRSSDVIRSTAFPEQKRDTHRFFYDNNIFPYGDAIGLRAMIADLHPKTIVEIGSGFSSACMLDSVDEFGFDTKFIFIDPYADRLKNLLRHEDYSRVVVIEKPVQDTDISVFKSLRRGDILFIDSTHVLKTGSDVHYELFHILPELSLGVLVHFHDIQFPFEYPSKWVLEDNYSWNEIYALRAFLMYNNHFRIVFWGNCYARHRLHIVEDTCPTFLKNPGGSLWIEKIRE